MTFTIDSACLLALVGLLAEGIRRMGRIEATIIAMQKRTDEELQEVRDRAALYGRHLRHHRRAILQLGGSLPVDEEPV